MEEYAEMVWKACLLLHKLVNEQKENVFIHDGAGISRCSTVLVAFLTLFGLENVDT